MASTATPLLNFLPLDWVAVSGMATIALAVATFYTLWQYRRHEKETIKRDVFEKVLQPIYKSAQSIAHSIESDFRRYATMPWDDVKSNLYLVSKIDPALKNDIEQFHAEFQKLRHLSDQQYGKIRDLVCKSITNAVGAGATFPALNEQQKELFLGSWFRFSVGGKDHFVTFWKLILSKKTLTDFIEEAKRDDDIPNQIISDVRFEVNGANVILSSGDAEGLSKFIAGQPGAFFEKAATNIRQAIEGDKDLSGFLDQMREVHDRATALEGRITRT